jgi:hypothetical protein
MAWPEKLNATVSAVQDFRNDFMTILPLAGPLCGGGVIPAMQGDPNIAHSQIHLSERRYRFYR